MSGGSSRELDALADEAIAVAVARQIDAGLDVVTDGEMRRAHFVNSLFDAVEGIADNPVIDYFEGDGEVGPPPDPRVRERLRIVDNPMAREIQFLRSCTSWPAKVAIPAVSNFYMRQYETDAYPSREDYVGAHGPDHPRAGARRDRRGRALHPVRLPALSCAGGPREARRPRA